VTVSSTPKHLCSALFTSSQSQKNPIPPSFSLPKQLRPALVSLFLPLPAATPYAATFPVAETPIVSNFPSVSPMLKHHHSAPPDSSPMLKHHCSAFFTPFPSSFSLPLIDETIPSSNCFASLLKHHHSAPHSSIMLKHPPSAPSDSSPILKHQFSAVFIAIFRSLSVAATPAFPTTVQIAGCDMIKRQPTKQHHHEREPNLVGRTNRMVRQRYVNIMSNN
jgi:hypothetical protein